MAAPYVPFEGDIGHGLNCQVITISGQNDNMKSVTQPRSGVYSYA